MSLGTRLQNVYIASPGHPSIAGEAWILPKPNHAQLHNCLVFSWFTHCTSGVNYFSTTKINTPARKLTIGMLSGNKNVTVKTLLIGCFNSIESPSKHSWIWGIWPPIGNGRMWFIYCKQRLLTEHIIQLPYINQGGFPNLYLHILCRSNAWQLSLQVIYTVCGLCTDKRNPLVDIS